MPADRDEDALLAMGEVPVRDFVVDGLWIIWGAAGDEVCDKSRVRSTATGSSGVCQTSIQEGWEGERESSGNKNRRGTNAWKGGQGHIRWHVASPGEFQMVKSWVRLVESSFQYCLEAMC